MNSEEYLDEASGRAVAVLFSNGENGYTVLRLEGDEGLFTAVGCIPCPAPGEYYDLRGRWTTHPEHGRQFQTLSFQRSLPETIPQIEAFLASGLFSGVGRSTARRICERFGEQALEVLRDNPGAMAEVRGITPERAMEMGETFAWQYELRSLMDFTCTMGLAPETALRLHTRYGSAALGVLTDNPYILIDDYFGVPFGSIDEFALKMGVHPNAGIRYEAALRATLLHNQNDGHVFLPRGKLCGAAAQLLKLPDAAPMQDALESLIEQEEVVCETILREEACYTQSMYCAECGTAERLTEIARTRTRCREEDAEPLIAAAEREMGIEYAPLQRQAILKAASEGLMILTGGPGTGKTTAIRGILSVYEQMGLEVELAAPTGRAAKRMTALTGREARTLHRLLEAGYTPDHTRSVFQRNEANPIDADAVIVDELSMVDLALMYALLCALKRGTRLILVGDADQLPSVGAGHVLRDLLASGVLPAVRLDEIFRQARESRIILTAHMVNEGLVPSVEPQEAGSDYFFMKRSRPEDAAALVTELVRTRLPGYRGLSSQDIQVICPTKQRGCGTTALNERLQDALNPWKPGMQEIRTPLCGLRTGDRVMQTVNDYDLPWQSDSGEAGLGVFNGDIGTVEEVDAKAGFLTVRYDDRLATYAAEQAGELDLAYAITVHKAQGSEFPCVVFVAFDGASKLLTRNLLYTALTRARSLLVIVGRPEILEQMTRNNHTRKRYTALRIRLRREAGREENGGDGDGSGENSEKI